MFNLQKIRKDVKIMGKSKLIKKGLVQKAKRNNGGMDIQEYQDKIMK